MNWILSAFFLIFIFYIYNLVGSITFDCLKINKVTFAHKVLAGFTLVSLIQWIVGFFAQLYHISWMSYMLFMFIGYILFFIVIFTLARKNQYVLQKINKSIVINHIKCFWVIYIVCIIFSFFSMTSQLPYLQMNYDDYYYIGRIIQEIGTSQLASENYYMGSVEVLSFDRIITTYEITYGFWSSIFNISPSFFARSTMVIHNYLMAFFSFYFIASLFIRDKKNIQYTIFVLFILIIPAGYLAGNNIIDMYDGWQFNTAIWYGGSVVRVIGIPLLLLSVFIGKHSIKYGILAFSIISTVLVSYSAIAITTIFLFVITTISTLMISMFFSRKKVSVRILLGIIIVAIVSFLVFLNNIELVMPLEFVEKIQLAVDNFNLNNEPRLENSMLLYISIFCSIMLLFVSNKKEKNIVYIILFSTLFFYIPFLTYPLAVSTMGYFFVISRAFTSIQILLLLLTGIFFVKIIDDNKKKILPIAIMSLLVLTVVFQINNLEEYKNYVYLGSGLSDSGYSMQRLIKNQYMIPKVFIDFGDYLADQSEDRYQLVAPHIIDYEGGPLELNLGMIMSSNNIEICNSYKGNCFPDNSEYKKIFNQFLEGEILLFSEFERISKNNGIDFVVTNNNDVLGVMLENNYTVAVESISLRNEKVYLVDMR